MTALAIFTGVCVAAFTAFLYYPTDRSGVDTVTTTASFRPQELAAEYVGGNTYRLYRNGAKRQLIGHFSANELAQFGVVPIGWTPEGPKANQARLDSIRAALNR